MKAAKIAEFVFAILFAQAAAGAAVGFVVPIAYALFRTLTN